MTYQILSCQKNEITELRQIAYETFYNSYSHLNSTESFNQYLENNFSEFQIEKEFSNPNSFFFFLKNEKSICGYTKLNINDAQTENKGADYLEIERIYLQKKWQGKGLGRKLMNHAIDFAKQQEIAKVWLGVWEKNPTAIAFYKKCGFEFCGEHDFVLGEERQTDFLMELKIKKT